MTLADAIVAVHEARGPLPAGTVAVELRKRKSEVLRAYHANPDRFVHTGSTKASRWDVRQDGFDAAEAAAWWGVDVATAEEFIFGREGFLDRGIVASLGGNGRIVVTQLGLQVAAAMEACA